MGRASYELKFSMELRQGCSANKRGVGTQPKTNILKQLRTSQFKTASNSFQSKTWNKVRERRSHGYPPHYIPALRAPVAGWVTGLLWCVWVRPAHKNISLWQLYRGGLHSLCIVLCRHSGFACSERPQFVQDARALCHLQFCANGATISHDHLAYHLAASAAKSRSALSQNQSGCAFEWWQ